MDDGKTISLQEIDAALKQRGFVRDWQRPLPCYVGDLDKTALRIPVSMEIQDTNFVTPPVVRLLRSGEARLKPVAHRFRRYLYVWLAGNGSIAQSLLCDGPDHACYKCMKPELAGQPRYRAVRSENDLRLDSNASCGD